MSAIDSRYLQERTTAATTDYPAFRALERKINLLPEPMRSESRAQLRGLKMRQFRYSEILKAVEWLEKNGMPPEGTPCRFPIHWISRPGKLESLRLRFERAERKEVERRRDRELLGVREPEKFRAEISTAAGLGLFRLEYPTLADQRRAVIRIFNLHREKFGTAELSDPAAWRLAVALAVEEIAALSELTMERRKLAE